MIALKTLPKEEKRRKGMIVINEELCKGCTLCVNVCPFHLIQIADHISSKGYYPAKFVDLEGKCTGCTLCAIICPDVAIEVYR
ncbi:4Fe-4S binding protein [Candidatus Bathyarchaeota archaeon]|nr:4Fe-4S binding protein [Candidatus Bathyarchaeota archaeon]